MPEQALVTVGTAAQYAQAAQTLVTLGSFLPDAALFFCCTDRSLRNAEQGLLPHGTQLLYADELSGLHPQRTGFSLDAAQLCAYCGLLALHRLLVKFDIIYLACAGTTGCMPLPRPDENQLLYPADSTCTPPALLAIGGGTHTAAFLSYCVGWQHRLYASLQNEANLAHASALRTQVLSLWRSARHYGCQVCASEPLRLAVQPPTAPCASDVFCHFTDGAPVINALRDYYNADYRLREACGDHPFGCIEAWTKHNVIAGDCSMLTLPAAALALLRARHDVSAAFPHYEGQDREAFLYWFLQHGLSEAGLPQAWGDAVRSGLAQAQQAHARAAAENRRFLRRLRNFLRRLLGKPPLAPAQPWPETPVPAFGVNLCGPFYENSPQGTLVRTLAELLRKAEIPFTCIDFRTHAFSSLPDAQCPAADNRFCYAISLLCIAPDALAAFRRSVAASVHTRHYEIAVWPNICHLPANDAVLPDEIWVCTNVQCRALAAYADTVVRMPCIPAPPERHTLTHCNFGLPDNRFLVLLHFHPEHPLGRIALEDGIKAFCEAFPDGGLFPATLVVSMPAAYREPDDSLLQAITDSRDMLLLSQDFSYEERCALTACCDVCLNLHRDAPFFEECAAAIAAGVPVLYTDGGICSELIADGGTAVPSTAIPDTNTGVPLFTPNVRKAAQLLNRLCQNEAERARVSARARELLPKAVIQADAFAARLREIPPKA